MLRAALLPTGCCTTFCEHKGDSRSVARQDAPNDFGRAGYGGPCPPPGHGAHRYFFTLYAVDVPALDVHGRIRQAFERALEAHALATARLMGRYERKGKR